MIVTSERKYVPPAPCTLPAAAKTKAVSVVSRPITFSRAWASPARGSLRTRSPTVEPSDGSRWKVDCAFAGAGARIRAADRTPPERVDRTPRARFILGPPVRRNADAILRPGIREAMDWFELLESVTERESGGPGRFRPARLPSEQDHQTCDERRDPPLRRLHREQEDGGVETPEDRNDH